MSDEIEMRVRHYANYWAYDEHVWYVDIAADAPGHARQLLLVGDLVARIDGGDPGDEDDGEGARR